MIHRSILALRFGCRTLADPKGSKRNKIAFVEKLVLQKPVASQKLVTDEISNPREVLNIDHAIWCNPWNRRLASNASFPDLFRQCLQKSSSVYAILNSYLSSELPSEKEDMEPLLHELGSYSYHSGLHVAD